MVAISNFLALARLTNSPEERTSTAQSTVTIFCVLTYVNPNVPDVPNVVRESLYLDSR